MNAGLRLWLDSRHLAHEELLTRLHISPGTHAAAWPGASPRAAPLEHFEQGARVACSPWRAADCSTQLTCAGLAFGRRDASRTVGLVDLPQVLAAQLLEAREMSLQPGQRASATALRDAALKALAADLLHRHAWRLDLVGASNIGFGAGTGSTSNTTIHADTGQRVGLHLDSWDRLPPLERWQGQNRICINLGAGERSLQFVPMPVVDMVAALKKRGRDVVVDREAQRDSTGRLDLARTFLETFPATPVVRMRMRPGEAYIAPTENLIHDGCVHSPARDLTLTVRGRIVPLLS